MLAGRRRIFVLAALALAIPLPALALEGGTEEAPAGAPAPQALSVATSLGRCGIGEAQVFCTLNVSFNAVDGASSYSATVTRADGSVVDYGSVDAGGTSLYVPYVGAGSYSVRVSAYGALPTEEGEDGREDTGAEKDPGNIIATDEDLAGPESDDPRVAGNAGADGDAGQGETGQGSIGNATSTESPGADEGAAPPPAAPPPCQPTPPPPPPELPPLPEPPPPDTDPDNPDEDADGIPDAEEQVAYDKAVADRAAAEAAAAAAQPESVECPAAPPTGP